jgi:hypothetical protein
MMHWRMLSLFGRACLGILLILNGPADVLAMGIVSAHSPGSGAAQTAEARGDAKQPGRCCGRCATRAQAKTRATETAAKNDIRPTCPKCPSCPYHPQGCCVSCPSKAPCSPPLVFVIPQSPVLAWLLADGDISFADSRKDAPILPPRFWQFVARTI